MEKVTKMMLVAIAVFGLATFGAAQSITTTDTGTVAITSQTGGAVAGALLYNAWNGCWFGSDGFLYTVGTVVLKADGTSMAGYTTAGVRQEQGDVIVAKYNSSGGAPVWVGTYNPGGTAATKHNSRGNAITGDNKGNLYVVGATNVGGAGAAGTDILVMNILTSTGALQAAGTWAGKAVAAGQVTAAVAGIDEFDTVDLYDQTAATINGADEAFGVTINPANGKILVTGSTGGIAATGFFTDIFVLQLTTAGVLDAAGFNATPGATDATAVPVINLRSKAGVVLLNSQYAGKTATAVAPMESSMNAGMSITTDGSTTSGNIYVLGVSTTGGAVAGVNSFVYKLSSTGTMALNNAGVFGNFDWDNKPAGTASDNVARYVDGTGMGRKLIVDSAGAIFIVTTQFVAGFDNATIAKFTSAGVVDGSFGTAGAAFVFPSTGGGLGVTGQSFDIIGQTVGSNIFVTGTAQGANTGVLMAQITYQGAVVSSSISVYSPTSKDAGSSNIAAGVTSLYNPTMGAALNGSSTLYVVGGQNNSPATSLIDGLLLTYNLFGPASSTGGTIANGSTTGGGAGGCGAVGLDAVALLGIAYLLRRKANKS